MLPAQDACELRSVTARAFHADGRGRAKSGHVLHDLPVAGTDSKELLVPEMPAGFIDDGDLVGIGMRVDNSDDFRMLFAVM